MLECEFKGNYFVKLKKKNFNNLNTKQSSSL